ncbi:MAG: hypothetical protein CBC28_00535 [Flavobacteriaceae bacterium TMED68]|nr:MAG: hypothetical protein CBC28_00535 [Flavobacteriaceae bacterium TMED68]|tara:strand:- start:5 stop:883 length:879 start_codon:yes stop_codon:yes gene_type:complete
MNSNVSIVIPVYNEELHIENVVESVEKYCENIIVVDDKSTDSSLDILKKLETKYSKKIFILENEKNSGIGYSVKKGFSKALELDNDIVIKFDGDNQHLPEDIPKFIEKITKEGFDFVKGNRFLNNAYSKPMPNLKILGNLITTNLQKIVSGNYAISDPNNGFLGVKKECLNIIDFKNLKNNYFFENSLLINMSSLGLKIGEVPIQTIYQNEKSSIPIFMASLKIIPTFIIFFYMRNVLNAKFNLSINSIVFFIFLIIFVINLFVNNLSLWAVSIFLLITYLIIDIFNFYSKN